MAATLEQLPSGLVIITPDSTLASDDVRIGGPQGIPCSRARSYRVLVDLNSATGYTVKARTYPAGLPVGAGFPLSASATAIPYPRNSTTPLAADAALTDGVGFDILSNGDDLVLNIATAAPSGGPPKIYVTPIVG